MYWGRWRYHRPPAFWYRVCWISLIIYLLLVVLVTYHFFHSFKGIGSTVIFVIVLVVLVPSYILIMVARYNVDQIRRDLTHVVFVIILGLIISLFLSVRAEWVPSPVVESNTFFENMSISIERVSPLFLPLKSIVHPLDTKILVTIYNYTPIEPVSVSMSPPPNTIFDYQNFKSDNESSTYNQRLKSFGYYTIINAKHTGHIFNSSSEYVINLDYRNTPMLQNKTITRMPFAKTAVTPVSAPISNLINVKVTNITSSPPHPINISRTIDNDLRTRWSAPGENQSITYTFDRRYNVSKVGIAFYRGDVRQASFEINGQRFNSSGGTITLENFTLNPPVVNANTLKIIGHGNSENPWNSYTEVKNYGTPFIPSTKTPKSNATIYRNSVPFEWSVRMTDLSLTTYFWIVMAGVITSRFMSLILDKTDDIELKKQNELEKKRSIQIIKPRDGLWIIFSFIIALILFSSFRQSVTLTTTILFNISLAFAFGFGFDKTLEVTPRFSYRFRTEQPRLGEGQGGQQGQPPGGEGQGGQQGQPPGGGE